MRPRGSAKPIWPWRMWYWTTANESLFDLSKDEMVIWQLLVDEIFKTDTR